MKKFISVLLCVAILVTSLALFGVAAQEHELGDGEYPIVFVTGIGQSYSYLYDTAEAAEADKAAGVVDNANARWNLFCNDFSFLWKEVSTYVQILRIVGGVLGTLALGKNIVSKDAVSKLVTSLFRYNTIDENGKLPGNIYTPLQKCSVADMKPDFKDNFYRTIPCEDVADQIGEENLYCFNYSAFSFTYDNAENLADFIENVVLAQTGAEKVVLVPMSMGASVVSAYLQDHGTDGKVARVVSIVGAWYGSDVLADLIELKYTPNAPELLYNGIVADLIGEPWGYLVNVVLRIFRKAALRSLIDEILGTIVNDLVLKTPSLCGLIPCDRYDTIREKIAAIPGREYILEQTDKYQECQKGLKDRMLMLNSEYGVDFFFLAGYGLKFGGFSSDYEFFQFFNSADTTNSDEIIQISSTVPGSTFVKPGDTFDSAYLASHDAKYISPDKSVDVSTSVFPDRAWLFEGQKHELENNNTALKLAFDLACGRIDNVEDGMDTYARFNGSRDLKKLRRDYIRDMEKWLETNTLTAEQQAVYDECSKAVNDMMNSTQNNRESDDKIISNYYNMMVDFGIYAASDDSGSNAGTKILKGLNDTVYKIFGAKGFLDFFKKNA